MLPSHMAIHSSLASLVVSLQLPLRHGIPYVHPTILQGLLLTSTQVTIVAIYSRFSPSNSNANCSGGSCSNATLIGLLVFVTFAMYWISEWLKVCALFVLDHCNADSLRTPSMLPLLVSTVRGTFAPTTFPRMPPVLHFDEQRPIALVPSLLVA
jgi:hypothetical protein